MSKHRRLERSVKWGVTLHLARGMYYMVGCEHGLQCKSIW